MYQLEGEGDHHQDHGSLFLPPSIELTSSAILDCLVNIFIDTQPPESIRDNALHSLLALESRIMMTTINGSPSVCPWHYETFHLVHLFFCIYQWYNSPPHRVSQSAFLNKLFPAGVFLFRLRQDLNFNSC